MSDVAWRPHEGVQTRFLASSTFEVLYGGAAGGGKSESLLVAPLRWIGEQHFRALLMRRTIPELDQSNGLIDRSRLIYMALGGVYQSQRKRWRFPSGAEIRFDSCEHEENRYKYASAEFQFVGFDELTTFTEKIYTYLISRMRSAHGLPVRLRAGTNPGGPGHRWVMKRFAPWLYERGKNLDEYRGPYAKPEQVKWFKGAELVSKGTPGASSRAFFPAQLEDNPALIDSGYSDRLEAMNELDFQRLRKGNWLARPAPGMFYRRSWFRWLDVEPSQVIARCRAWDLAATEDGGDWTVGMRGSLTREGLFVLEDVVRDQVGPGELAEFVETTADLDANDYGKGRVTQLIPQDPGQAGKKEAADFVRRMAGHDVKTNRPTGSKQVRARPASAQARGKNIAIVRAPWNSVLVDELEQFPEGTYDDQVDTLSDLIAELATHMPRGTFLDAMRIIAKKG